MASKIQLKRKINGTGSPPASGALEGEIALAFPGAAGATTKPEVWAFDGNAWRRANPDTTISTQSIDLNNPGAANIGAAYSAWAALPGNNISGNVVIATFGTPAQAYVLTDPNAPAQTASWTSLGGAVAFANAQEIHDGRDTTKAINSAILRGEALKTPSTGAAAAADEDRLIRLNANGQIDSLFLPAAPTNVRGGLDVTQAYAQASPPYHEGDMVFANKDGTVGTGWRNAAGQPVKSGDVLLYDGTDWYVLPNTTDLTAYLALAGGTMSDGGSITFDTTTGGAGTVIIDGNNGALDNCRIDGGTY